jgi:hypothetical protein
MKGKKFWVVPTTGEWGEDGPGEGGKGLELGAPIPLNGDGGSNSEDLEPEERVGWGSLPRRVESRENFIRNSGRRPFSPCDYLFVGEMVSKGNIEF